VLKVTITLLRTVMNNKKSEGGKGKKDEAATAGSDDNFDDMLAKLRAMDVTAEAATARSSSSSSSSSSRRKSGTEVLENMITRACIRGDIPQLRRWEKLGVRVSSAKPLCEAVSNRKLNVARFLVKYFGADVNQADNQDFTPLCTAAEMGSLEMAKCLVKELGADIKRTSNGGPAPVHLAARDGHLALMQCLIEEFGSDINQVAFFGCTAVYAACRYGHLDAVRFLVEEHCADVNLAMTDGSTPLIVAAEELKHEVVRYLLKHGADPQARRNVDSGTAANCSKNMNAPAEETAYIEARTQCANPSCINAGLKKWERCLQIYFCGSACTRAHWPAHKAECTAPAARLKAATGF
jgi:ankyrin repeat protein